MTLNLFSLIDTLEVRVDKSQQIIRIEILKSTNIYRTRIWLSEVYNLYPSTLNSDSVGNCLANIHSADTLNRDVTTIVLTSQSQLDGEASESKEEYIKKLLPLVTVFINSLT